MQEISVDKIVAALAKADDAYYNSGKSIITDAEYDKLRSALKELDPDNPYFSNVGISIPDHREEVKLMIHMGSQNKASNDREMEAWYVKYGYPGIVISDKLDGSSMEAVYIGGELKRVATRGDGETGMNITRNAMMWSGLPHKINQTGKVVVRGEAQLSVSLWKDLYSDSPNPRNCGNGIVACDTNYSRNENITFHAFDIVKSGYEYETHFEKLTDLIDLGFNVVNNVLLTSNAKDFQGLHAIRRQYIESRTDLDFEIDGMIVTINDMKTYESLGYSDGGTRPKGSVAWKFDTISAETTVKDIEITIGHTGAIIPTAVLEPVMIAGTTVSHCLLNNFQYIIDKNINIGDVVEVEKAGDIIPKTVRVVQKNTDGPYQPPTVWSASDGKEYPIIREGRYWKVIDEDCPDLSFQRIRNWVNKTNIKHLGDTTLLEMVKSGMVNDIDDLYRVKASDLSKLVVGNGVVGSNADKIVEEISKTKSLTVDKVIGAISIKFLGRSRAKLLVNHGFNDAKAYLEMSESSLVGLPCSDTGTYSQEVASQIWSSLQNRKSIITKLMEVLSIDDIDEKVITNTDSAISGKTFCFSGVRIKGDDKDRFDSLGGVEKSGVSAGLDYLVLKDVNSTSSKAEKARGLGTAIISLDDFLKLIG